MAGEQGNDTCFVFYSQTPALVECSTENGMLCVLFRELLWIFEHDLCQKTETKRYVNTFIF